METPEHRRSATRHHLLRGNIKLLFNVDPKSPNPDLRNITNQCAQSLHSSCASRSVSATSSVEYSHQEPVKRTAEANHPANSIREHSNRNSTHLPKTNRRNDQSPENPKNSKVTPSTHLHLKFAETTPKRGREGSVTVHQQSQPTDRCCHQFVENNRCCVVPRTTKHERQTPTTAETVEGTFYSHLATGGTDRLYETIRDSTCIKKPPKRIPSEGIIPEKPSCAEDPQ